MVVYDLFHVFYGINGFDLHYISKSLTQNAKRIHNETKKQQKRRKLDDNSNAFEIIS